MSKLCPTGLFYPGLITRGLLYPIAICLPLILFSCGSMVKEVSHRVHYTVVENTRSLPKKVVLLTVKIPVWQVRKGPVIDQLEKRSLVASKLIPDTIRAYLKRYKNFRVLKLPVLSKVDKVNLEKYIVLYDLVSRNAINYTNRKNLKAWHSKLVHFDYGIGKGLGVVLKKTKATAALIVTGKEILISGSDLKLRHSTYLIVGLVDLKSGALLWLNYVLDVKKEFNNSDDVKGLVNDIMGNYPGLGSYKKAIHNYK